MNNKNVLISVIIPVCNVEQYLVKCLQSVSNQDYPCYEVLLIDDGSQDNSGIICDQWAHGDYRFKVYHKENGGLSDARNFGLNHCNGEYICFVDSDDYLEPTCLSYLYELINRSSKCAISQANHCIIRGTKSELNYKGSQDYILTQHEAAEAVLFHDRVDVSAWGKLYHRSIFDSLRYPKGRVFEDTFIFGEILAKSEEYVYGHISQYNYVKNPESIVNQSFTSKNLSYIEATERMTSQILAQYPDLWIGCIRRMNHSRLSVLRYMEHCEIEYNNVREELRKQVLKESKKYIHDSRTPLRDKIAVSLLKIGLKAFYYGWNIYSDNRNG